MFSPLLLTSIPSWPQGSQVWVSNWWPARSSALTQWHWESAFHLRLCPHSEGLAHRGVRAWACMSSCPHPPNPTLETCVHPWLWDLLSEITHRNRLLWVLDGQALWAVWPGSPREPWGWCALWTGSRPWPWPFWLCEKGHSWRRAKTRQVLGRAQECSELRIKPLWKSYVLKAAVFAVIPRPWEWIKEGISYVNVTTSESLWSTFLLVLQGKIISPLALKGN